MTPGTYLRLRREAAELSVDDVAMMITSAPCWLAFDAAMLVAIEADRRLPSPELIDRLRGAFAFDRFVFRQLATRCQPDPEVCGLCGCSALDACDHEAIGACAWADAAHDLCTHCAGPMASARPEETRHA